MIETLSGKRWNSESVPGKYFDFIRNIAKVYVLTKTIAQ